MDTIDRVWQDMQDERRWFLQCRLKNIALAQGTYNPPWWHDPKKLRSTLRQQDILGSLYT